MNSKPLDILYIDTEHVWRGGQEQLFGLMQGMASRGHRISLASPAGSPLAARAKRIGILHHPFRQHSELSLWSVFRLLKILAKQKCDVVHFNTQKTILIGGLVARIFRRPVTVTSRRVNFPLASSLSSFKYNRVLDRIYTVSSSIKATLIQNGVNGDLIEVIYEGVDLDWIDAQEAPSVLEFGEGLILGTVAHLSAEKGHITLLEAARILKDEWPDTNYLIVGEGDLRPRLEALVREHGLVDNVVFTGFREDSEALMKQFDLFCLPSLSEGLSSAILAAMASRLPVVSTSVGGIPELVVDGETGYLVPPEDPHRLAEALAKLFASADQREQMGEAGRKRIQREFTVEQKLDATEVSYLKLLEAKGIG